MREQSTHNHPGLTPLREALLLAAEAPENADYVALLDACIALAHERSECELRALELADAIARLKAQMDRLTAAEAVQRITEIRTGLGQ
jgi:acyl transferase domain-containing protein